MTNNGEEMNFEEYIKGVVRTENTDYKGIRERMSSVTSIRALHGSIGITTEAGELLDAVKKYIFYGRELDVVNIKEEIGDLMYYSALLADEFGFNLNLILQNNIEKLRARYPEKFTEDSAINRDLGKEREILEK